MPATKSKTQKTAVKKAVTPKPAVKKITGPPTINIYEAKTQFSKLVDLASSGTNVVIARNGRPVALLTQLKNEKRKINFGVLKGKGWIADDFDAPLPEDFLLRSEKC